MSRPLIYVIADYGPLQDLAFAEVTQCLYAEMHTDPAIHTLAVPAFDTVATGFVLAQLAINSKLGSRQKFYVNTAPRADDPAPRQDNHGEALAYAKLFNGIEIVAVNSGYSLSFIKQAATEIRAVNVSRSGSQFRSRDVFAPAFARIAAGDHSALGDDITDQIPDMPENCVCYTDGYGNLKCSVDAAALEATKGQSATLTINGQSCNALVAGGIFGVPDGAFSFAAGSSGWTLPDGKTIRFTEIVKRSGSAANALGNPRGGAPIAWHPAT